MTLLSRLFVGLVWIGLALPHTAARAEDSLLEGESLGKIAIGQKAEALPDLLGKAKKGKDTLWGATGEWVQEWKFKKQGVTLNMASGSEGGAKTVLSITAVSPCKLATARGIKIGSSEAEVREAYGKVEAREDSVPGETFVAGSIYGGVIFTFKDGKVAKIFVGAAAE
ncbi:MAG: hypothetical protein KDL87_14955 [Verrucomicrobiae bacterium]|nr:hypothetical protein [Verrucomicrobiae bacterium]